MMKNQKKSAEKSDLEYINKKITINLNNLDKTNQVNITKQIMYENKEKQSLSGELWYYKDDPRKLGIRLSEEQKEQIEQIEKSNLIQKLSWENQYIKKEEKDKIKREKEKILKEEQNKREVIEYINTMLTI